MTDRFQVLQTYTGTPPSPFALRPDRTSLMLAPRYASVLLACAALLYAVQPTNRRILSRLWRSGEFRAH